MHHHKIEMTGAQAQAILNRGVVPALADNQAAILILTTPLDPAGNGGDTCVITSNIKSTHVVKKLLEHCIKILQQDIAKTN